MGRSALSWGCCTPPCAAPSGTLGCLITVSCATKGSVVCFVIFILEGLLKLKVVINFLEQDLPITCKYKIIFEVSLGTMN